MCSTEYLLRFFSIKNSFPIINLQLTMIKTNSISLIPTDTTIRNRSVKKQRSIVRVVLRIMQIPAAIHLKPVYVNLFWQAKDIAHRRKDNNPLLQLIETEQYVVINHAMIADTTVIKVCITLIIWDIMPQHCFVLWFNYPYIEASIIRS